MKIILCENNNGADSNLKSILEKQGMEIVAEANNGFGALKLAAHMQPDLIIVDADLPLLNGNELVSELLRLGNTAKILILTTAADEKNVLQAYQAGIAACVLKARADVELLDAVRQLGKGKTYISPALTAQVVRSYARQRGRELLTTRETEILRLVAMDTSRALIASQLRVNQESIDTCRQQIMSKLRIQNVGGLVRHAVRQGIMRP